MPVNRYQYLGSSQPTIIEGAAIEGPPTADITLIPKNLGDPCSRNYYVQFTWSEPVEFIESIIFGNITETTISSGTSFSDDPSGTDIFIFTDDSTGTLSDYVDEDGTDKTSSSKGDVAQYSSSSSKWIYKGTLFLISIDSIASISIGSILPASPSDEDLFVFEIDGSSQSDYEDNLGNPLDDGKKGDIASYNSIAMKWIRYGNLATNDILIQSADSSKAKLIPGTLRSNNPLVWTAEVEIIDPGDSDDLDNPGAIAGQFTIGVNAESARGLLSNTIGPPSGNVTERSETFRYDFTDCVYPTVAIDIPPDTDESYQGLKNIVYFIWSEYVSNFTSSDISITDENGNDVDGLEITEFSAIDGINLIDLDPDVAYAVYFAIILFPDDSTGTAKITVISYSAIGASNPGPIEDIYETITYDTRIERGCIVVDVSGEGVLATQSTTENIALADNPYLDDALIYDGDHAGGLFNGVLELRKAGNFIFRVVQIMKQSFGYLRPLEQAGAALVRFNLDDTLSDRFDIVKTYSDVTLAARSLKLHDGYLYFMEGSHYIYYPETQFRSHDMTKPRRVEYTGGSAATLNSKQETIASLVDVSSSEWKRNIGGVFRIDASVDYKKGDVFQYTSSGWGSDPSGNLLDYNDISNIRNIYVGIEFIEDPNKYDIFIFSEDVSEGLSYKHSDASTLTSASAGHIAQYDGTNWIRRGILDGSETITLNEPNSFIVGTALPDSDDSVVSDIFIFSSIVETVSESNWRSATTEDEPNPEKDDDGNNILDYFYGVHGGTASPIVSDGDKIHLITGYGNLRQGLIRNARLSDSRIDVNLLDNWQLVQYSDKLNHKISQILTNNKSPYALMSDISNMTNSIFGFSNEFFMKPRDPRKANLNIDISLSEISSIGLLSGSQSWNPANYPASGILLIEDELISYGDTDDGYSYNAATESASIVGGITRGIHGTTASDHDAETEVLWIDHYITSNMQRIEKPIQTLNITSQSEHIYNHIKVMYGSDKVYELEDDDSIAANGRELFEISTVLDDHQYDWAKWIGDTFLERFKDIHHIVDMELKTTLYMNIGDIVLIEQQDRVHMFSPCQVLDITQNPPDRSTNIKLITL